jgi:hypothetical protein
MAHVTQQRLKLEQSTNPLTDHFFVGPEHDYGYTLERAVLSQDSESVIYRHSHNSAEPLPRSELRPEKIPSLSAIKVSARWLALGLSCDGVDALPQRSRPWPP